jgi:sugar lactone lactonase YvrE
MDAAIRALSDVVCRLGEGPSYDTVAHALWWFDIVEKRLVEHRWPDGPTIVHELPFMASAIASVDETRQLVVAEDGLYLRERSDGTLRRIAAVEADRPENRSNDARVHPSGALWFGTMGKKLEKRAGAIYWHLAGETRLLFPEISIPNSICFSPDGAVAYYADTGRNLLFHVACDPATGLPSGAPSILLDHRGQPGGLDGSVCDSEGVIWNARWGAARIDAYAADGRHLRRLDMPVRQPSCPAFVGPQADRLACTSAWEGMDDEARRADPDAGRTFLIDLPVRGRLEPFARP